MLDDSKDRETAERERDKYGTADVKPSNAGRRITNIDVPNESYGQLLQYWPCARSDNEHEPEVQLGWAGTRV